MDGTVLVICVICTITCVIGISLHAITIYFLKQSTSSEIHQKTFLLNFCSLEIAVLVMVQVTLYAGIAKFKAYAMLVMYGIAWPWVHLLVVLTVDRFLRVYLSIKYDVVVTERMKKLVLFGCYLTGIILIVFIILIHVLHSPHSSSEIIRTIVYPVHGVLVMMSMLVTYVYIGYKMYSNRRNVDQQENGITIRQHLNHFIPLLVVLSHFLFAILPNIFWSFHPSTLRKDHRSALLRLLWTLNFTVDAVICIVFNPRIRTKFWRGIRCSRISSDG